MILQGLRPRDTYALMTSIIVPRPIAWVSTRDREGRTNLAPFSYFNGVCADPPMVTIAVSDRRDGTRKDTVRIAEETGVLCINLVEEPDAVVMNASSADMPPHVSEIEALDVETEPCAAIDCVRVKSSRAALECRLVDVHRYGRKSKVNLCVCEVAAFYVADELLEDNHASPHAVAPVARLGQHWFAKLGERFSLERP